MPTVSLTEARARLPELLDRAATGEEFTITRHGVPAAVIVGHDRWMKTATHDVLRKAREIGQAIEAARDRPLPRFPTSTDYDYEAHIADLRRDRGQDRPDASG